MSREPYRPSYRWSPEQTILLVQAIQADGGAHPYQLARTLVERHPHFLPDVKTVTNKIDMLCRKSEKPRATVSWKRLCEQLAREMYGEGWQIALLQRQAGLDSKQ